MGAADGIICSSAAPKGASAAVLRHLSRCWRGTDCVFSNTSMLIAMCIRPVMFIRPVAFTRPVMFIFEL